MDKLGYACINMTLTEKNITVNRGMIKRTFDSKGFFPCAKIVKNFCNLHEFYKKKKKNW